MVAATVTKVNEAGKGQRTDENVLKAVINKPKTVPIHRGRPRKHLIGQRDQDKSGLGQRSPFVCPKDRENSAYARLCSPTQQNPVV